MTNNRLGHEGEREAARVLRRHFLNVRYHADPRAEFDFIGIDKLTNERVAIEVKTTSATVGKLAHIETEAYLRKLSFLDRTNRRGIVLVIQVNGHTRYGLARLQQHISSGHLVPLVV